jgi:hypothetical protein
VAPVTSLARDGRLEPINPLNFNSGADAPPVVFVSIILNGALDVSAHDQ